MNVVPARAEFLYGGERTEMQVLAPVLFNARGIIYAFHN